LGEAEGGMNEIPKRRYKFSLRALLITIALLALLIGSYTVGYQKGYSKAKSEPQADYIIWKKAPPAE
jgi:hypothetical protein